MRKESGFDPHDLSYADAQGLLQMIPPTTQRVAKELKIPYDPGRLYEPEYNIETGSWYIGHLLQKFKGQIPLGAGSFNSGPRPVMRWIDQYGDLDGDGWAEVVLNERAVEGDGQWRTLVLGAHDGKVRRDETGDLAVIDQLGCELVFEIL